MENIIRIPSQQSSFNATNNLVDIVIPGDSGVYDLSECYVTIDTRLTVVNDVAAGDAAQIYGGSPLPSSDGVQNIALAFSHGTGSVYNDTAVPVEALVRNASIFSQSRGKIEDIRRSDRLRATMKSYLQDLDDVQSAALTGMTPGAAKGNPWVLGRHAQLNGDGSVLSKEQSHEIRIYLRDIFEIGKVDAWDSAVYGDTRIHFELNLADISLKQALGQKLAATEAGFGGDAWALKYHNLTANANGVPQAPYQQSDDIVALTTDNVSVTQVTMAPEYQSLDDSPHWVGQILTVQTVDPQTASAGGAGGTVAPTIASDAKKWAVVSGVTYDPVTKKITLDFNAPIATITGLTMASPAGAGFRIGIRIAGRDFVKATSSISYDSIELTAIRRTDMQSGPKQIQYSQFMGQSDQFASASTLNRSYFLPARTTNCIIVLPAKDANGSDILGSARLTDYRFSVDGESVTNRAVPYMPTAAVDNTAIDAKMDAGSALHYDLISNTMMNIGQRYSSLNECVYDQIVPVNTAPDGVGGGAAVGYQTLASCPRKRAYMLALPIPMKEEQTQLNIELEGSFLNGTGQLEIYSLVTSVI